jgi:uncharacterized membrane protein YheB (UPF0754 family)
MCNTIPTPQWEIPARTAHVAKQIAHVVMQYVLRQTPNAMRRQLRPHSLRLEWHGASAIECLMIPYEQNKRTQTHRQVAPPKKLSATQQSYLRERVVCQRSVSTVRGTLLDW